MKLSEFNEIYDKYYLMVMKVAFNVVHDYYHAQDICQEVFLFLHRKGDSVPPEVMKAWLIVTAQRKAIDFIRKGYVKREICEDSTNVDEGFYDGIAEVIVEKVFRDGLFSELEEKDKLGYDILMRVMVDGKSQRSVAEEMGLSLPNVRIRLHRAKAWMRKNFYDED